MISEKEIIKILDKKLKWKESIEVVEKEMKNVFTATEMCMLEERKTQMKYTIEDIAKQIISKLPKVELISDEGLLDFIKKYGNKNIKIYVEIVDVNKKDKK